jgi:transposase
VRHREIRRLAHAIRAGRHALAANRAQLQVIVDQIAPGLTERRGIGAVTAAQAAEATPPFAALSGTSPLQASSGKTVRHRLNRGGDRALNRAIHTIVITRLRCCPTTKNYVARRTAEGNPAERFSGASRATSPASSTAPSTPAPRSPPKHRQLQRPLDKT